ncbi:trimethylguanosine synthase-like isoform X3 [Cloeon dipterum]|uniref:trimethylguanosine synthase-like isoform X3 n=1 Tax=Cloeon dipterum TaxID=197152 RepID=UPI00321FA5D4
MAECNRVSLADVVLRLEGGSSLVCHCTRAKFSAAVIPAPRLAYHNQTSALKADHEKSISETFTDDYEQIFQFDEQQQPIQAQPLCLPFNAESRWSFLNYPKTFSEDSSPSLSWSSSSDSMTSVTSLDEAMLSLSSSDSEEEDSQKARTLVQATIIPVQDAMRYFGFHFLPTNDDSTITSTEIISHQKDKQTAADQLYKQSKKQLNHLMCDKKEMTNGDWLIHLAKRGACDVVVDALCGDGELAVQLAQSCRKVIAIDSDPMKIKQAQQRAEMSCVTNKIDFVLGDFLQMKTHLVADAVFLRLSNVNSIFDEQVVCDLNLFHGAELFQQAKFVSSNIVFCLPSNQDARQILQLVGEGEMELEQCCVEGHFSAMAAYSGPLFYQSR